MSDFVENLNSSVASLTQQAKADSQLKDALMTEKTSQGARVGDWEIIVHEGIYRSYSVLSLYSGQPIAEKLYLYEAALALVKFLNAGVPINDSRILDLFRLEEDYVRNRNRAAEHKSVLRAQEKNLDPRAQISFELHQESALRARAARAALLALVGLD